MPTRWYDPLGDGRERESRSGVPTPIGQTLRALAARRKWESRLVAGRILEHWEQIVGRQIAGHAYPIRLRGGVLVLRAESPLWADEVQMLGTEIAARVNQLLGSETVTKITVTTKR